MQPGVAERYERFSDRREAGSVLAARLIHYARRPDVVVLGLPRGGVPVASAVARALGAPVDVFVVRKLGVPGHRELAMGAIATGGVRVLNRTVVDSLQIPARAIEKVAVEEGRELARREYAYRGNRPPVALRDRIVILVDDGFATGATMRAAVTAVRRLAPARIVVAVPVGARETCRELEQEADEVVCAVSPTPFTAVGLWYEDFSETSDEEVRTLLAASNAARSAAGAS